MSEADLHNNKINVLRLLNNNSIEDCISVLENAIEDLKKIGSASLLNISDECYDLLEKDIPN